MSALRQHYRIVLDGTKYELTTNARDVASAEGRENISETEAAFRVIHAACLRLKFEGIPDTWEGFADLLDDVERLDEDGDEPADPTPPAASASSPSPSRSSRASRTRSG